MSSSAAAATGSPCDTTTSAPPQRFSHVVVIVLENHSFNDIIGPAGSPAAQAAPYLNGLARSCGVASDYHSVTHPSLPNYLALTAGSTFGVTGDCKCTFPVGGVFLQAQQAHRGWGAYAEGMPSPCYPLRSVDGRYTQRHNPPTIYTALVATCPRDDLALGSPTSGALASALSAASLPGYVYIAPDLCDDMHDCGISTGDGWLAHWIPRIVQSHAYQSNTTAIFITFDEGSGGTGAFGEDCSANPTDQSCHVPLVVVSRYTEPGTTVTRTLTHYSLLRASDFLLGLPPLRNARLAAGLVAAFNL